MNQDDDSIQMGICRIEKMTGMNKYFRQESIDRVGKRTANTNKPQIVEPNQTSQQRAVSIPIHILTQTHTHAFQIYKKVYHKTTTLIQLVMSIRRQHNLKKKKLQTLPPLTYIFPTTTKNSSRIQSIQQKNNKKTLGLNHMQQ